jgi:hypothetical protein
MHTVPSVVSRISGTVWLRALVRLTGVVLALVLTGTGCRDNTHSGLVGGDGHRPPGVVTDNCGAPNEGCTCDDVGQFAPCGDVTIRSGDYVTCSMGQRECLYDHVWGECLGDHMTTKYAPQTSQRLQATTGPAACVGNACDPYCKATGDDGMGLTSLPSGLCNVPGGGLVACGPQCGYSGPHAPGYASLSSTWKKQPATCTQAADTCGYDANCTAAGVCSDWTFPCYDPNPASCALAKKVDLELGPPCGTTAAYHFQVCNRGANRADTGTIKIGVYSSNAKLATAVTTLSPGVPDQGIVTFTLGTTAGKYIDPGRCLDVTASNSTAVGLALSGTRAVAVNYDQSYVNGECNYANNWHAYDSTLACQGCAGLECAQTCAAANLTGTIKDPGGVNPLPGVVVYVPNGTVQPLVDGVACDTCSTLYSGIPIASAVTGFDGKFTLTNVPVAVSFPLVMQTGRWRRQVTVAAITGACGTGTPTAALPAGESSQLPSKGSEGDIPRIALSMSAGDHLECLLKKIGLEDAAFSAPSGSGRIHLYAYNGLTYPGTTCTAPTNGTCANDLWSSPSKLDTYSAVIAPCDKNSFGGNPAAYNPYVCNPVSATCPNAEYGAGPFTFPGGKNQYGFTSAATAGDPTSAVNGTNPLNTTLPPFPTLPDVNNPTGPDIPSATEQNNLKTYIDKGGRLFATHWMAYFLTRTTYPSAVNYVYGSYVDADRQTPDFPYTIDQTSAVGKSMADWLASPTVTFTIWRHLALSVNSPAVRLAYGDSTQAPVSHPANTTKWGGPMVSAFQFDAPWGVASANQCGRVVVAESHVSKLTGSTATTDQQTAFPISCDTTAMTGEEKAFEFLLFSATQCVGLVSPPPPAPTLMPATYTVDYQATCPSGTKPEWEFFSWKATVPPSTSIDFTAATASTQASLATATPVSAGIAGTANANAAIWTSITSTVEQQLQAAMPQQSSRDWLRIAITVNPNGNTTPTLLQWQQTFDCKPAE